MTKLNAWKLAAAIATALLLVSAATAQYTPVGLYQYPNTGNNTSGITNNSFLAQGPDGELYDTDWDNGTYSQGSVYTMSLSGDYSVLYSFCVEGGNCLVTGSNPQGGVTLGSDGNFYGTTTYGGTDGYGTVFKITPAGKLTTLFSFPSTGADGSNPAFPVFQASNGDFYGVTPSGGEYGNGAFFSITSTGSFKLLASFPLTSDGYNPNPPTQGTDGNFYGTTHNGGACCGTVYKITAAGVITLLYTFPGGQGSPVGQLAEGSDGNFWGVTNGVPFISCGELFKVSPSGDFTVVHTFTGNSNGDGCSQVSGLIVGSDGNLYGVTNAGGTANAGTIYNVNPSTGDETVLYSFCSTSSCPAGFAPGPVLLQDTNGTFFGNTGGNSDGGSWFFSFDTGLGPFVRTLTQSGEVGATVTFLGQDFTGATQVEFDGVSAQFKIISDTELAAAVPAAGATGPVSVVTPGGRLTALSNFKVLPKIISFSPASGPVGTTVTIMGTGFTQVKGVGFGDTVPATNLKVVSDTEVTADVPAGAKTGPVGIETKGGIGISTQTFTVTQ